MVVNNKGILQIFCKNVLLIIKKFIRIKKIFIACQTAVSVLSVIICYFNIVKKLGK